MLLISRYKPLLLLFLFLLLGACSASKPTIKKTPLSSTKQPIAVKVIEDNDLGVSDVLTKKDTNVNLLESINHRVPVFILASTLNSSSSIYGQSLCNSLNNDFSNDKYICIVQNQPNVEEWVNYLKKDNLSVNPDVPFVADFLVTRVDYLIEKQQHNSGPLADYPILDAVMFLNGNYLYLWGDNSYSAVEFSNFVSNYTNKNKGVPLKIAVSNKLAKSLLTKLILANKWDTHFEFIDLEENLRNMSNTNNYILIADAGPYISNNVEKYIDQYYKNFVPLSLSHNIILNTQKSNPEISQEEVSRYYNTVYLTNIVRTLSHIENSSNNIENSSDSNDINKNNPESASVENEEVDTNDNGVPPFITVVKYGIDYDKYVFGKSKFGFNIKPVNEILKENKIINANNIKVMGIGIKNILVATRVTDPLKVYSLASAFLSKYDLIKVNYNTPDMCNSNIHSLLLGNLYYNNLIYHYGIINFITYATNNRTSLWGKEAEIVNVISKYLDNTNSPPFYGPNMPNSEQINIIKQESRKRVIKNKQEKALESFQSLIEDIKKELNLNSLNNINFNSEAHTSLPSTSNNGPQNTQNKKNKVKEELFPLTGYDDNLGKFNNLGLSPTSDKATSGAESSTNSQPITEDDLINVLNDLQDLLDNSN